MTYSSNPEQNNPSENLRSTINSGELLTPEAMYRLLGEIAVLPAT